MAATRAIELDDSLAEAHGALGEVAVKDMDVKGAIRHLQHAIELNPGLTMVHTMLGRLYYCCERHREAQEAML